MKSALLVIAVVVLVSNVASSLVVSNPGGFDAGQSSDSKGNSVPYARDTSVYSGTKSTYDEPTGYSKSGYEAPAPSGYKAPTTYSSPDRKSGYEAPAPSGYKAPTTYSIPERKSGYEDPTPSGYKAPTTYSIPERKSGYEDPKPSGYQAPHDRSSGYQAPAPSGYQAPHDRSIGYQAPAPSGYQAPHDRSSGYQAPVPSGYQAPHARSSGYQAPTGYADPHASSGYGAPTYSDRRPSTGGFFPSGPAPRSFNNRQSGSDIVDLLFAKADAAKDLLNTLREQLGAQEARQSLQKKVYDRLMILGDLQNTDILNGEKIDLQEYAVAQLEASVDALAKALSKVIPVNEENLQMHESNLIAFAREQAVDVRQTSEVLELRTAAENIQRKTDQALENAVAVFEAGLAITSVNADGVTATEQRRMCEVGEVTLTQGDQLAEYAFQTVFTSVPQVMYSVQGLDVSFAADAQRMRRVSPRFNYASGSSYGSGNGYNSGPSYSGGNGYNSGPSYNGGGNGYNDQPSYGPSYGPSRSGPQTLGFRVNAYPTLDTLTVEVNGLVSFNDYEVAAVTVSFQACSIGTGTGPLAHH